MLRPSQRRNFGNALVPRVILAGVLFLSSAPLGAQGFGGGDCTPVLWNVQNTQTFSTGPITWLSQATIRCTDGTEIRADSAVVFGSTGENELIGRVRVDSPTRALRGNLVNYNSRTGVLFARGAVTFTDWTEGHEIVGDTLTFLAEGNGRIEDLIIVSGRQARATFPATGGGATAAGEAPGDAATSSSPYLVTANHMRFEGSRYFWAGGEVAINRDSLNAVADSMIFDQEQGSLILIGETSLESGGLLFLGERMNLSLPGDELREIVVLGAARLETEEMTIIGDEIRPSLEDGELQRIVAVRREGSAESRRPYAVAEEVFLMADSIDLRTPEGALEAIYAVGNAWSERREPGDSLPDLSIERPSARTIVPGSLPSRDWVEGEEIEILFTQVPPVPGAADGAEGDPEYEISTLFAKGSAGSFYLSTGEREESTEGEVTTEELQMFDYTRADEIRMTFAGGEVSHVEAVGNVAGVHVELPIASLPIPSSGEASDD